MLDIISSDVDGCPCPIEHMGLRRRSLPRWYGPRRKWIDAMKSPMKRNDRDLRKDTTAAARADTFTELKVLPLHGGPLTHEERMMIENWVLSPARSKTVEFGPAYSNIHTTYARGVWKHAKNSSMHRGDNPPHRYPQLVSSLHI